MPKVHVNKIVQVLLEVKSKTLTHLFQRHDNLWLSQGWARLLTITPSSYSGNTCSVCALCLLKENNSINYWIIYTKQYWLVDCRLARLIIDNRSWLAHMSDISIVDSVRLIVWVCTDPCVWHICIQDLCTRLNWQPGIYFKRRTWKCTK